MIRKQEPITADNWLYQDQVEQRIFAKFIFLGVDALEWKECTDEEKIAWEMEHKKEQEAIDTESI